MSSAAAAAAASEMRESGPAFMRSLRASTDFGNAAGQELPPGAAAALKDQVLEVVREQLAAEAAGSAVASEASARVAEQLAEQVAALKGQVAALQEGDPEADFIKQVIE
eukprot:3214464-Pyramimonas_sp.AAC.1